MSAHKSELAVWETKDLRLAIDAAGVALWSWNWCKEGVVGTLRMDRDRLAA